MKQLAYFIAVGLAFTVLQVATVEAQGPACDPNPACDPSDPTGNCCPTCDPNPACVMDDANAQPCCGPTEEPPMCGDVPCPPPGEEHHDGEPHDPPMCGDVPCPPPGEHHDDGKEG